VGLYREYILPWGIEWTLNNPQCRELRRRITEGLQGRVLEIGFGTGLNMPHYPDSVDRVYAVDPLTYARKLAAKRIAASSIPVEFTGVDGQAIPLDDDTVDSVLSTWTLCSILNLPRALGELRRVLKPRGRFHFLEHGLSPDGKVARWQRRLTPIQKVIGGGCRLDLPVAETLRSAGFTMASQESFYMKGPRIGSYMYMGVAVAAPGDGGETPA
jgi:ubiquinone/menaquinone biosynthesis C-methylase UbiE